MKGMFGKLREPGRRSHKGENGKLLIVAGSRKYHGAPAFCILGARRFCDLIYFMGGEPSTGVLQQVRSIPEAIITQELPEADAALYGPGLGDAKFPFSHLRKYSRKVIDGDGLRRVPKPGLEGSIITPHEGEFRRMFGMPGTPANVESAARNHKCTILKKGPTDYISNGETLIRNKRGNAGMTKGGTGDVLAGLTAALFCTNSAFIAACCAARIATFAGDMLYEENSYAYCASDLARALPFAYKELKGK
jgi:hydroxyethylthiazole kinase-like uncharacterized protein yjeF